MEGLESVIQAGQQNAEPRNAEGHDYALVPDGTSLKDLEAFQEAPRRARANAALQDEASFNAYVELFRVTESSRIFADPQNFRLVFIADYHTPKEPAFGEHRATFTMPKAREWATWRASSGKRMGHVEFAQFIEENQIDIRVPAGAKVLEVARGLSAKRTVQFQSAARLSNGDVDFSYSEETAGTVGKGKAAVPEEFKLGIPVFFGGAAYEVVAKLRYRLDEGKLALWYDLHRPEYIEKDAFDQVIRSVAKQTGITPWLGTP